MQVMKTGVMKAAQIGHYGENAFEINRHASKPALAAGHVLIENYAAGVNPIDLSKGQSGCYNKIELMALFETE